MFAATIVPQSYLHLVEEDPYHLALAHLINKPGFEYYTEFYKSIGRNHQDKILILDNGVIEGDPRPIAELFEKAQLLNADELVLPDVFQQRTATLRASYDALEYLHAQDKDAPISYMAVPQGATYEQWLDCAKEMCTWSIGVLSIPKVVTKLAGRDGRLRALLDLQELIYENDLDVHLLGCWESPLELKVIENYTRQQRIRPVRGVDSAIAYVYARAGLKMSEAERPPGAIDFAANDADVKLLRYNIEMWKHECGEVKGDAQIQRIW